MTGLEVVVVDWFSLAPVDGVWVLVVVARGFRLLAVGVDAGLLLFGLVECLSWLFSLSLLATVRGGTSFLCPTATKKRSKENAFQPLILKCPQRAGTSFWHVRRTVLARAPDV